MLIGTLSLPTEVSAQSAGTADVTYSGDVAHILQESCVRCHRPGTAAPMALQSYEDVRRWGRRIQNAVQAGMMPPGWYVDPTVGIQDFKNDPKLPSHEIQAIVDWVEAGMPEGNASDLPEPVEFKPDHEYWALEDNQGWGPPDLIIESPPFTVPANSGDQWWEPDAAIQDVIDRELLGERWIRAVETVSYTHLTLPTLLLV